jgi:single-stranded-DNA-specific exonuclease
MPIAPQGKLWNILQNQLPMPAAVEAELLDFPPVLRQLLHNRGYKTKVEANNFLFANSPENTDPFLMKGIPEAVDRIHFALQQGEPVAIYGDYDADGVTATALLVQFLENLGAPVIGYIPNRFDEGYGLNKEALSSLHDQGIRLVITVDCGIRSPDEADFARQVGLDLIITDHHHVGDNVPQALSVINPKQPGDCYPEKNLAGVGLAYKLASGLVGKIVKDGDSIPDHHQADQYLDLVALGTIADMVPLIGENRALVRKGLEQIRKPHRQGIQSLIGVTGLKPGSITSGDVGYMLGPRLNAAGRLESALTALNMLISQDVHEASELAQRLEVQNRERQEITRSMQLRAEALAMQRAGKQFLLFAADPEFNPGVVGLVASRLTETYYRPSIIAFRDVEFTRGSCRSIPQFHITEALDKCSDLLVRHGGHAAAAGFTVRNENLPELIERLDHIAEEILSGETLQPTLNADLELPLHELKPEILDFIQWLQPTGQANPQAVFVSRDLKVTRFRPVGKDNAHLKLTVTDGKITYDAIAFRQGEWQNHMPPKVDLMYVFETNEYNGQRYLQLNVKDIQPSQ